MLKLTDKFHEAWQGQDVYHLLSNMEGEIFREKEGRRTFRFDLGGQSYFAKVFSGMGWRRLAACVLKFRKPVISAENEWRAIEMLLKIGIPTMRVVGYGKRGHNPARMQSFLITEELKPTISLEDFCRDWITAPPQTHFKRALIERLAHIAGALHENGIVHRDLYLCHFLMDAAIADDGDHRSIPTVFLIDLHRAEKRRRIKNRWRIKDLAGLYFSSMDIGLTKRDRLRFIAAYSRRPWQDALREEAGFWEKVKRRGESGYREFQRKNPSLSR